MIKRLFLIILCVVLYVGSASVELRDISGFVGIVCVVSIVIWY